MATSEGVARDSTEDWILPEAARPRSFGELEAQIDYALTVARSSEAAVAEIGAVAIDSAEESRRAAAAAERAALAIEEMATRGAAATVAAPGRTASPESAPNGAEAPANPALYPLPSDEDLRLAHFMERADRVVERLRALERLAS